MNRDSGKTWIEKSSVTQMQIVYEIYNNSPALKSYDLNYKDHYIGLVHNGISQNPIKFRPRQQFTDLECYWIPSLKAYENYLDGMNLQFDYNKSSKCLKFTLKSNNDYYENKELIDKVIAASVNNRIHSTNR